MCTLGFCGKGYSLSFIKNYKNIVKQLQVDEDLPIEVVEFMDDICSTCPNKIDNIVCNTQEQILKLDKTHLKILRLKIGQVLTWKQAKERIKTYVTIKRFHFSCKGCLWKKYGVCEQALRDLLGK